MVAAGPNSPDLASTGGGAGQPWTNASNVTASDDTYATVPTDATIKGILVEIERKVAGS